MALLDFGSNDSATPISTPGISKEGQDLIDRTAKRAQTPQKSDYGDQIAYGQQGLASPGAINQGLMQEGGGSDPAMSQAISDRMQRGYSDRTAGLRSRESLNTFQKNSQAQQQAFNFVEAKQRVDTRNAEMVLKAYQDNQAARAATLRSVLGVAGMLAGAAIAGPAGAMAGGAIASSAVPQNSPVGGGSPLDKYGNGSLGADLDTSKPYGPNAGLDFDRPPPSKHNKYSLGEEY